MKKSNGKRRSNQKRPSNQDVLFSAAKQSICVQFPFLKPFITLYQKKKALRLGLICVAFLVAVGGGVCFYWSTTGESKQPTNYSATTSGDNSSATIFSANTSGTNSPINQSVNITSYPTNEVAELLKGQREQANRDEEILSWMKKFQDDSKLKAKFNLGYILFTATETRRIIPFNSPMDDIIQIDWKSGYEVALTETHVNLRLPTLTIHPPDGPRMILHGGSYEVLRRIKPWAGPGIYNNGKIRVAIKVVDTNQDNVVVALGIQSPPEPRPSMEDLSR